MGHKKERKEDEWKLYYGESDGIVVQLMKLAGAASAAGTCHTPSSISPARYSSDCVGVRQLQLRPSAS
jgi:hypothetical protein